MTVLALARKYYPRLWSRERIEALAAAGRLSREEADAVLAESAPVTEPESGPET